MIDESKLPRHLYLSNGWKKPRPNGTIGPTEDFSSTMLDSFECQRQGAFKYILGIKEEFKNQNAQEGVVVHGVLEHIVDTGFPPPNTQQRFIERAMSALPYLPGSIPSAPVNVRIYAEAEDWIDTTRIAPELEPLRILVKKDLEYCGDSGVPVVIDYKTISPSADGKTSAWERMKTPEEVASTTQGVLYPVSTMQKFGTAVCGGRWIYINMDPAALPEARPVDVSFSWGERAEKAHSIFKHANEIRKLIRLRVHPNDLPPNPQCCLKYYSSKRGTGGCMYRPEVGGPCSYDLPKRQFFSNPGNYLLMTAPTIAPFPSSPVAMAPPAGPAPKPYAEWPDLPPGFEYFQHPNGQWDTRQWVAPAPVVTAPVAPPAAPVAPTMPPLPAGVPFAPPEAVAPAPVAAPVVAPAVLPPGAPAQPEPKKRGRKPKEAAAAAPAVSPTPAPAASTESDDALEISEVFVLITYTNGLSATIPVDGDARNTIGSIGHDRLREALGA